MDCWLKKILSKEEGFQYPSLSNPDGSLRQRKNKATLSKQVMKDCPSSKSDIILSNNRCIYGGMILFRKVAPHTYQGGLKFVAKTDAGKSTKIKQLILKLLVINT